MEEIKDKNGYKSHPEGCRCMMHGGHHLLLKAAFLIIILAITFSLGVKFGEIKAFMKHGYFGGHRMMMGGYGGSYGGYYPGMMRGYDDPVRQSPISSTTPLQAQ